MIIQMKENDKKLENGNYEILIDTLPIEAEIVTKETATMCWLLKAEYIMPLDKYKAIYRPYHM